MCLAPRTKISNSKYINAYGLGSISITFPCGKCSECREAKKKEYIMRSDAMYKDTLLNNGFTYWETFTYSNKHVPTFNFKTGFSRGFNPDEDTEYNTFKCKCSELGIPINKSPKDKLLTFYRKDYVNMMKRLRFNLTKAGYSLFHLDENGKKVSNLKYFFVSEYGGKTHRPHYHCLFYLTIPKLTPDVFFEHLKKAWQLGRLDEDKDPQAKVINGQGAINYVAKYVVKDDEFSSVLKQFVYDYNLESLIDIKELMPFHRQSIGFGLPILKQQDYQKMYDTGKMIYEDKKGKHLVEIPAYIKRKIFYEVVKDDYGTQHWRLNELGKQFALEHLNSQVDALETRYKRAIDILPAFFDGEELKKYQKQISYFLNPIKEDGECLCPILGRTIKDLAIYNRLYRGHIKPYHDNRPDLNDESYLGPHISYAPQFAIEALQGPDVYDLLEGTNIFSQWLFTQDSKEFLSFSGDRYYSLADFAATFVINQNSYQDFMYFDYLTNILQYILLLEGQAKDADYKRKEQLKARLRNRFNKYNF